MTTVAEYADRIWTLIGEDVVEGVVPPTVTTFSDLHEHVDANDYTLQVGVPWGADVATDDDPAGVRFTNAVEDEVSRRLTEANLHDFCPADAHDREVDPSLTAEEQKRDADGLLACNHCSLPAFWCERTGQYHHLDPAAPACFLIGA